MAMREYPRVLPLGGILLVGVLLAGVPTGPSALAAGGGGRTLHTGLAPSEGRIAFVDYSAGVLDTVNPDGSALVQVTDPDVDGVVNGRTAWTPDGTHLVYSASRDGGDFKIYTIRADGTGRRLVVPDKKGYFDFLPEVTPDGRWVLFTRCRPDPPGGCAIYAAHWHGKLRLHAVVPYGSRHKDISATWPVVSPNGRRLAFTRGGVRGITQQVWVSRIDGSHAHAVSKPAQEFAATSWLGGRHLVVSGPNAHVGSRLYTLPVSGGSPALLAKTHYPNSDFFGDASPSGEHIAYLGDQDFPDTNGNHLYVVDSAGANHHKVDVGLDTVAAPRWGTAAVLPASAGTPRADLARPLSARERRAVDARASLVPGWVDRLLDEGFVR